MDCIREALRLYAITDRRYLRGKTLADQVREAIEGGVTLLQLREKELSGGELLQEARTVKEVCEKYHVPLIINDNVELALQVDADGVHVGQSDMGAEEARKILGSDKIIGVTARTAEQAVEAERRGADYIGSGAVFGSRSKQDARPLERTVLEEICRSVQIPVVAIGGIGAENIEQLTGSGICGAAVIGGIFAKSDVKKAAEELRKKIDRMMEAAER